MKRLAIVTSHPIQYYAPLFKLLAKSIDLKVFYTAGGGVNESQFESGFGREIKWDIPLLDGYEYEFVPNSAPNASTDNFNGIINPTLFSRINTFNPHALLVYGWAYKSHLKVLINFKGKIPVWFRGDSTLITNQTGIKKLLRNQFLKWVYKHVDIAFYVGTANKAYFLNAGMKIEQLRFTPHAVDNERFAADRRAEALSFRQSINLSKDDIMILFVGKLDENKQPDLLLNSFISLNLPHTHLIYVGDGPLKNELMVKAKAHERIHFLEFQNQNHMPIFYQASDLTCLPSKNETWGLAINEAMAGGNAILTSSNVGCAIDLVKEGRNGEIFQFDNSESLKSKLALLTKNKEVLLEMGRQSQSIISSWNYEKQAMAILNELDATN